MSLDVRVNREMMEVIKSLMKAQCFFMLLIDGSPFADIEGISKQIFADNGIQLSSLDSEMTLEEAKQLPVESRDRLLVVPDCMDVTMDELVEAHIPFAVVINKLKLDEPVPFFDRECLKITIKILFGNMDSQVEVLKWAFGENSKMVFITSINHGVKESQVYSQINEINAILDSEDSPEKQEARLNSFMEMQGFEQKKPKAVQPQACLEENEAIEFEEPRVSECFDPVVLNSSISVDVVIRMAQKAGSRGFSLMFTGGSGTGKTAFAHYLASRLGRRIIIATPSQILQKWWGNTERNIQHLFDAAKESGSVLLFDEIDTYLGKRGDVTEVNQKHWTTIVNTFLQEMERFSGIMIGTTNMKENVDSAFIRRFNRIVDFSYPGRTAVEHLWERYFPQYMVSSQDLDALAQFGTLGPGDFANLWDTCRYMEEDEISTEFIMTELMRAAEMRGGKKRRPMGFRIN